MRSWTNKKITMAIKIPAYDMISVKKRQLECPSKKDKISSPNKAPIIPNDVTIPEIKANRLGGSHSVANFNAPTNAKADPAGGAAGYGVKLS